MLKQCFKLAALAGIALIAGYCSQQNPMSAQSENLHPRVGLNSSLPPGLQVPSELETVTNPQSGTMYIIAKGTNGQVMYKYRQLGNNWNGWWGGTYYAVSNIATVASRGNSQYNVPAAVWVFFQGGTSPDLSADTNLVVLTNIVGNGINLQNYYVSGYLNPPGVKFSAYSNLAAVMDNTGYPGVFCVNSTNYTLDYWGVYAGGYKNASGNYQLSNIPLGWFIAADTLSSGYGTNGYLAAFAIDGGPRTDGNLVLLNQTSALYTSGKYSSNPPPFATKFDTIGSYCGCPLTVAKNKDGHLEVFTCTSNGSTFWIMHDWQINATTWSGYSTLTSAVASDVFSVGTNADGRLELFFASFYYGDNRAIMMHQWQTAPSTGPWSTAIPLSPNGGSSPPQYYPYELVGSWGEGYLPQCVGVVDSNGTFNEDFFSVSNLNPTDSIYYIQQIPSGAGWTNWTMFN
ncbi:MAG: hypothetical protein ABSE00_02385 [Chitinispirillaceae bacterium]|jgi:hypothetical protein